METAPPRLTMPDRYRPSEFEAARYARWQAAGAFAADTASDRPAWSMILPPPNITGRLHMGHAYEHTICDAFTRFRRMQGYEALWLPGIDHAGIATQNIIERQLAAEGLTRHDIGREAFWELAWERKRASGDAIADQMGRLGASPDWSRATFTLDPGPQRAVRTIFARLFADGLVYQAARTVGWCDRCTTALADIEIDTGEGGERCSRCASPIERRDSTQWFLRAAPLATAAREAVESGDLTIEPASMRGDYLEWLDGIHDWCISRQLWWGHRIPVWYGPDGEAASFADDGDVPSGWTQDPDVLDTWFSSALWPLTTLGWPDRTAELDRFYPTTLLCTGSDLMFFWCIRMMMLCCYVTGRGPFRTLYLHGMVRDANGRKMSKSSGNAVDPLGYIDRYGADPLRIALARQARPGADVPFGDDDMAGAEALAKKLWNITRFAVHHAGSPEAGSPEAGNPDAGWPGAGRPGSDAFDTDGSGGAAGPLLARWLGSRVESLRQETTDRFEALDLAAVTEGLARFITDDLSDFWLEAIRPTLTDAGPAATACRAALRATLRTLFVLAHPIAPFLTEELTAHVTGDDPILDQVDWPRSRSDRTDPVAEATVSGLRAAISHARRHKADLGLSQSDLMAATVDGTMFERELRAMARLAPPPPGFEPAVTASWGTLGLGLPGADSLDGPGRARLERRRADLVERRSRTEARLADPKFCARAPADVVAASRRHLADCTDALSRLETLLDT